MCHRSHQLTVLDDRTAAHPLDDPARQCQKLLIYHLHNNASVDIFPVQIYFDNFHIIELRLSSDGTDDLCWSQFNLLLQGNRNRLKNGRHPHFRITYAENPLLSVLCDLSNHIIAVILDIACQFPRTSIGSSGDPDNLCLIQCPLLQVHQNGSIHIVNAMSQRAERAICILIGHRSNSLRIISDPNSHLPFLVLIRIRCNHNIRYFPIPFDGKYHIFSLRGFHRSDEMFLILHLLAIYFQDIIALLECIFRG